jgi:hypothetical protein
MQCHSPSVSIPYCPLNFDNVQCSSNITPTPHSLATNRPQHAMGCINRGHLIPLMRPRLRKHLLRAQTALRPRGGLPLAATAMRRAFLWPTGFIGIKTTLFPCSHISNNYHILSILTHRAGVAADLAAGGVVGVVEDVGTPLVIPLILPLQSLKPTCRLQPASSILPNLPSCPCLT